MLYNMVRRSYQLRIPHVVTCTSPRNITARAITRIRMRFGLHCHVLVETARTSLGFLHTSWLLRQIANVTLSPTQPKSKEKKARRAPRATETPQQKQKSDWPSGDSSVGDQLKLKNKGKHACKAGVIGETTSQREKPGYSN